MISLDLKIVFHCTKIGMKLQSQLISTTVSSNVSALWGVGTLLLSMVRLHDPAVTPQKLLRLEFNCDEEDELHLFWVLSHMWST